MHVHTYISDIVFGVLLSDMSNNDQINHMREFIMHEAKERCADIEDEVSFVHTLSLHELVHWQATRAFTLDKQRITENGKAKV